TDFLSLFQAGITNTVASLGTSLTPNQVSIALRFAPRMIISYDSDDAGKKATLRAASLGLEKGIQVGVITLPEGFDPDSFLKKYGAASFKNLLKKAIPGFKFFMDAQIQGKKIEIPEEKTRIARNIITEIEKIPDPLIRSEYLKQASEYLSIDESLLRSITKRKSEIKMKQDKPSFLQAEKRLLQILWEDRLIATQVFKEMDDGDFEGLKSEPIFRAVADELFKNGKVQSPHEIKQKIEPNLFSSLSEILQEKGQKPSIEEARDQIFTLRQFSLDNQAKKLKVQIDKAEKMGESHKISPLIRQFQDIKNQLLTLSQHNPQDTRYNTGESIAKDRS
ncbi:unnamed protein product, partial [marine sediment metagenome]